MISQIQHISIVGSGNVARFIAHALFQKGFQIAQIISRNPDNAKELAEQVGAAHGNRLDEALDCDLLILAVNDDTIHALVEQVRLKQVIVCHTAGAVGIDALRQFEQSGILYPLQSIKGPKAIDEVPFLLEASDLATEKTLSQFLNQVGLIFRVANSEQRLRYHLAAVFANNFTNAVISASEKIVRDYQLDFEILKPLIRHTFENALKNSASQSQTGPALRNDLETMQKHLDLIKDHKELVDLYQTISNYIVKQLAQ